MDPKKHRCSCGLCYILPTKLVRSKDNICFDKTKVCDMNYEVLAHYDSFSPNINELEMEKPYWPPENLPAPTLREKWELEPFLRGCLRGTFPIGFSKDAINGNQLAKLIRHKAAKALDQKSLPQSFLRIFLPNRTIL